MAVNFQWQTTVDPKGSAGTSEVVEFSPDGTLVAAGNSAGEIRLLNASTGAEVDRITYLAGATSKKGGEVEAVSFSPNGQLLAASGNGGGIKVFRLSDKSVVASFSAKDSDGIAFSPDGRYLATSDGGSVVVRSTSDWSTKYKVSAGQSLNSMDFSRDGQFMVIGGSGSEGTQGGIKILRTATGETVRSITTQGGVKSVRISPDGSLIATANARGYTLQVYRFSDGSLVKNIPQPEYMEAVAWTGKYLLAGGSSSSAETMRIYDSGNNFGLVEQVAANNNSIEYIDVRGSSILTSGEDGVVKKFSLGSGYSSTPSPAPSPAPVPAPTPTPGPVTTPGSNQQKIVVEAEDIQQLSGFRRETNLSGASGGAGISFVGGKSDERGSATFDFTGVAGKYNVQVGYYDETDGVASANLEIEGKQVSSWTFDQSLGSSSADSRSRTSHLISNVTLSPGDTIKLSGLEQKDEHVRIDNVTFTKI